MKIQRPDRCIFLISILLPLMACSIFIGGPAYPDYTIPITTEAVGDLQVSIDQAVALADDAGLVTLVITESQITSYFALRLLEQEDPLLENPQVYLQDDQVQIYGTITQGYFQATSTIILGAGVDQNGQVGIEIISADFGPLPIPREFLEAVSAILMEAFTGSIGPVATGIRMTSITIADGVMTIYGQIK